MSRDLQKDLSFSTPHKFFQTLTYLFNLYEKSKFVVYGKPENIFVENTEVLERLLVYKNDRLPKNIILGGK